MERSLFLGLPVEAASDVERFDALIRVEQALDQDRAIEPAAGQHADDCGFASHGIGVDLPVRAAIKVGLAPAANASGYEIH
jgi:hypothetical protein